MDSNSSINAAASLNPELRALLSNLWLGNADSNSLVDWAIDQLVANRDTQNLRILAGLSGPNIGEAEFYFRKVLTEMGASLPNKNECLIFYCGDVARETLASSTADSYRVLNVTWQVLTLLQYPPVLRCWLQLEHDLDLLDYQEAPTAEMTRAVCEVCEHFLWVLEGYAENSHPLLTGERSLEILRRRGHSTPGSAAAIPQRMPTIEDGNHLSFFRTFLESEDFRDLTLPWTKFLRSEILQCHFENADLTQSSMTWCDWKKSIFQGACLRGCDLRRSVFEDCFFYNCNLDDADLRGAQFTNCHFSSASMERTKVLKQFGISKKIRQLELKLSADQVAQIDWCATAGEEPRGG